MTTLLGLIQKLQKIVEKEGDKALKFPVYSVHSASGELCEDVSAFVSEVTKGDLDMSSLGKKDLGKKYICISLD